MPHNKISVAEQQAPSYEVEMADLRQRLAGQPYCKEVNSLLPDVSKAHIRNVVNGRGRNPLVLAALKIVVNKLERGRNKAQQRLAELTEVFDEMQAVA